MAAICSRSKDERCAYVSELIADNDKCESWSIDMVCEKVHNTLCLSDGLLEKFIQLFTCKVLPGKHCMLAADNPSKASGWMSLMESKPAIIQPISAI